MSSSQADSIPLATGPYIPEAYGGLDGKILRPIPLLPRMPPRPRSVGRVMHDRLTALDSTFLELEQQDVGALMSIGA